GKGFWELEAVGIVVVEVRADDLVFGWHAPAGDEPRERFTWRRAADLHDWRGAVAGGEFSPGGSAPNHHMAPASVSCKEPAKAGMSTSRSPGKEMVSPITASSVVRRRRHTRGASTRM